ncbi:hypothetical protein DPEC_G00063990 [Dallia pectoralis]|uniref:Uncharacterized protein n=1 Tax=Dallia pectoralis TaxID=75939 RepID=A0ACC2H7K9_DALPE|nr:hypothetical protein DPEC_G00063990 [Dallia pectoralis]
MKIAAWSCASSPEEAQCQGAPLFPRSAVTAILKTPAASITKAAKSPRIDSLQPILGIEEPGRVGVLVVEMVKASHCPAAPYGGRGDPGPLASIPQSLQPCSHNRNIDFTAFISTEGKDKGTPVTFALYRPASCHRRLSTLRRVPSRRLIGPAGVDV